MLVGIPLIAYLALAACLFLLGLALLLTRRHALMALIGLELMLNAVNINLVAFSYYDPERIQGQMLALFVIVVAVSEIAIALAIASQLYRKYQSADLSF